MGELTAHLGECGWALAPCPNKGCTEARARKDLPAHNATCENRVQKCAHCEIEM